MRTFFLDSVVLLCILLVFSGCSKDKDPVPTNNGLLEMKVDWSLLPVAYKKPSGIAVTFFDISGQSSKLTYNFSADGGTKSITSGNYRILVVNNDYELVQIRYMEKWDDIEAYTSPITQEAYEQAPKNQPTMTESASRDGISGADLLMVSSEHGNMAVKSPPNRENQKITFKPQNRTIPVVVRIPVDQKGMQYISQARGFLTGVSPSVKLVSGIKAQSPSQVLFEYGSALDGRELRASFSLFGWVDGGVANNEYKVGLEILLVDSSVLYYEFDVKDLITDPLRLAGGEIAIPTDVISIDPVEPLGEGFKPSIDNWEDDEIIVPLG